MVKKGASKAASTVGKKAIPKTAADLPDAEKSMLGEEWVSLTTHDGHFGSNPIDMVWGASNPMERGPVIATVKHGGQRNAIGAHSGGYCIYTALAVAAGELKQDHIPNLKTTDGCLQPLLREGLRHPPHHRRDQGAHRFP